jgi:hypothetical protein
VTSDYLGKYAANLAFVSKKIKPFDAAYADRCLKAAKALYDFTLPKLNSTNTSAYNGATIVTDDVAFGALALLWATGERKYLDDLCFDKTIGTKASATFPKLFQGGLFTNNDPLFSKTSANTDWASCQTHVLWGFFRLILNDQALCTELELSDAERLGLIEKTMVNLMANLSSVGAGAQTISLPEGVLWVPSAVKYDLPWFTMHTQMEWVWNRYQAGNITDMYYYYDIATRIQGVALPNTPASTDWKAAEVKTIMVRMLDYMFGVNPWDISMVYGVGEKNFNHPHHRAANPEGKNVPGAFYRYFPPVGALQGGYMPTATSVYSEHYDDYFHSETGIDGTTNIFMPVVGLAKEDTIGPPSGTVRIIYVGCEEAIIEVRQSRYGNAVIRYGAGPLAQKTASSDSAGVLHRITLKGLTRGTTYNFDVVVSDMFQRESVLLYLDEEKKYVKFSFTTPQNCPTNADISNVKVCKVTSDSAEIFWYTPNGEFDSKVVYGTQKPPTTVQDGDVSGHPVKFHYVKIGNLKEKTTYYFYVESGESRDDNKGQLYTFTTPVQYVKFDVRTLRYSWADKPALGVNIVNQDIKAYDSLELRLYFRDKEGFENDLGARIDIMVLYRADGFQDTITGELRRAIWANLATQKPTKMDDTYDPTDGTYAFYFTIPLWGVEMRSLSRIRLDVVFVRWEPERHQDLLDMAPLHQISNRDWSFGPHSRANGDPVDYPGVPVLPKNDVDETYFKQPINYYVTIYRKNQYVWGYSPSQAELKTKKTQYQMESQVTSPLNNPAADYVFIQRQNARTVDVSGWAKVEPIDGTLNDIWVNGVKQTNPSALFTKNAADGRFYFTIPVPVQNGRNNVDITLFSGPPSTCEECYGCAVSNHEFFVEFQGAKQYPSLLVLRDQANQPISDTAKLDTTIFNIVVTDRNGNQNVKAPDAVTVRIKNIVNGDSLTVTLTETGDSTGIFQTAVPIAVVDRTPAQTGSSQIAMNGGDRVRIWYVDPTDSADSSEAFLVSRANFPLAGRGWLKDSDGNGAADMLVVEYSMPLKQNVDSITINFPNATTGYTARAATDGFSIANNTQIVLYKQQLPDGITGFSSMLYSSGISYLTSNGLVKASPFPLFDSIGPVLNGQAIVRERLEAGTDTITLTLSEAVKMEKITGSTLLLRRAGVDYPVQVIGVMGSSGLVDTIICNAGGVNFTAGDSLRFNSASELTDLSSNRPHAKNRGVPVLIKAGLPRIVYAYFLDTDYNGIIDNVRIGFSKPVTAENLRVGLKWSGNSMKTIGNATIGLSDGSATEITVRTDSTFTNNTVSTAGPMLAAVVQAASPGDTVFSEAADSAAPVISTARFTLYNGDVSAGTFSDTLRIVFSEPLAPDAAARIATFSMMSTQTPYQFDVTGCKSIGSREYLFYGRSQGREYPVNGDLIWLLPASRVADIKGNVQLSENNRHVPVSVDDVGFSLKDVEKTACPNPFNPLYEKYRVTLKLKASRFPFQLDSTARVRIFDKVGTAVTELYSRPIQAGLEILWDGTNRKGRMVGEGSYLFTIFYKGEREKILVGVKRR